MTRDAAKERAPTLGRRLDAPWIAALITAAVYGVFLTAQLSNLAYDPSRFVRAGELFCNAQETPASLTIEPGAVGYDGQFYYRLALNPFTSERRARGIQLDSPAYRQQRIVYPLLVWTASLGREALVPAAMVLINYVGVCLIGGLGGALAGALGRHSLWGLLLAAYPGLWMTLSRDLTEITEAWLLLAGILCVTRGRFSAAAVWLSLAMLARETALGVAVAIGVANAAYRVLFRAAPRVPWRVAAVPLAVFVCWQAFLAYRWGEFALQAGGGNLDAPLRGLVTLLTRVIFERSAPHDLWLGQIVFFVVFSGCAACCLWRSSAAGHMRIAWALYAGLALSLGQVVWVEDWAFLRALTEFYLLGAILMLTGPRVLRVVIAVYVGVLWLVVVKTYLH